MRGKGIFVTYWIAIASISFFTLNTRGHEALLNEETDEELSLSGDTSKLGDESIANTAQESDVVIQMNPNINYVGMPSIDETPAKVSLEMEGARNLSAELEAIGAMMKEFWERMARGRIRISTSVGPVEKGPISSDHKHLVLMPGTSSHVPVIGNGISAKHELGHEFGLGHASTQIWASQNSVAHYSHEHDPFDPMTVSPGVPSLNAPHLHFLKWFGPTEEAYAEVGSEYTLRLINDGSRDFQSLKSLYYEVPGTQRALWVSYVRITGRGWKAPAGMPNTAVAIHSNAGGPAGSDTNLLELLGLSPKTNVRSGLIVKVSDPTPHDGKGSGAYGPKLVCASKHV